MMAKKRLSSLVAGFYYIGLEAPIIAVAWFYFLTSYTSQVTFNNLIYSLILFQGIWLAYLFDKVLDARSRGRKKMMYRSSFYREFRHSLYRDNTSFIYGLLAVILIFTIYLTLSFLTLTQSLICLLLCVIVGSYFFRISKVSLLRKGLFAAALLALAIMVFVCMPQWLLWQSPILAAENKEVGIINIIYLFRGIIYYLVHTLLQGGYFVVLTTLFMLNICATCLVKYRWDASSSKMLKIVKISFYLLAFLLLFSCFYWFTDLELIIVIVVSYTVLLLSYYGVKNDILQRCLFDISLLVTPVYFLVIK